MPKCYKQKSLSNELVLGQSPVGKNVSTEAEDIVGIRQQTTTGNDTGDCEDLVRTAECVN
jgi:hypothetical protein